MKQKRSFSLIHAVYAVSFFCVFFSVFDLILRPDFSGWAAVLSAGFLSGGAVLLLLPVSEESRSLSFWFSLVLAVVTCLGSFLRVTLPIRLCVILLLCLFYLSVRACVRYAQLRPLFRHIAVWYNLENHARLFYSVLLCFLVCCFLAVPASAWVAWVHAALAFSFYALLWYRVLYGRTALIAPAKEKEIQELIRGNLRTAPPQAGAGSDDVAKMSRVYQRVVSLMEQKRPFLDAKYNLSDMSTAVYTNKTYLSKTINIFSGRNFSQFVNYYRIRYCVEMLQQDPNLRLTSAAMMSGFHSTVTFNMAFKLNMGETPSSFKERLLMERQRS